jgi:hypothetical protein
VVIDDTTDRGALDSAVGKWVRVQGLLANGKIPQVAGVDVDLPSVPIRGTSSRRRIDFGHKPVWAEGVLERHVEGTGPPLLQTRTGTIYRLTDPATGDRAIVHAVGGNG